MKRHIRLQSLSREHHAALHLALQCERAAESGHEVSERCAQARSFFASSLLPHFAAEERDVMPLLDPLLAARLLDEHQQLAEAAVFLQQESAGALHAFAALLSAHVRFEEREAFVSVEQRLMQGGTET